MNPTKHRATGKNPAARQQASSAGEVSSKAAENKKPADKYGNTEPVNETNEKARHADGQNPPGKKPPAVATPGGSEQPGYRMKRARFAQS